VTTPIVTTTVFLTGFDNGAYFPLPGRCRRIVNPTTPFCKGENGASLQIERYQSVGQVHREIRLVKERANCKARADNGAVTYQLVIPYKEKEGKHGYTTENLLEGSLEIEGAGKSEAITTFFASLTTQMLYLRLKHFRSQGGCQRIIIARPDGLHDGCRQCGVDKKALDRLHPLLSRPCPQPVMLPIQTHL
jgi:hypothetical protein